MIIWQIAIVGYLAVGLAFGAWTVLLHDREQWRRLPELRWKGPLYVLGALTATSIAAVVWPYILIMAYRRYRADADGVQEAS